MANTANTILTSRDHGVESAKRFYDSVRAPNVHSYYVFVGQHVGQTNAAADLISDTVKGSVSDSFRHMAFGKQLIANNVAVVTRNVPYSSGVVYDMYDDQVESLYDQDFFVVSPDGTYHHVFKCLDNNLESNSTIAPAFADIVGSNTELYQTADGYKWKYMYSFNQSANDMFADSNYIPIVSNTTVESLAVRGSIDVIKITDVGRGYDNYMTGTFSASDLRVNGDSTVYQVSNATVATVNGFYTGCGLYISSGTGAGQYQPIVDYISNANGNFVVTNTFFTVSPTNGTQFEIFPEVIVVGDGRQSVNVVARALINASASNSVYRIEILERGAGYSTATATVIANDVVDVIRSAELRPILPPGNGHGNDPYSELGANKVTTFVTIANTDSVTLPLVNQFRQIGIIEDPRFTDVLVELTARTGAYLVGESLAIIDPIQVATGVTVSGANVISTGTNLLSPYASGDYIYMTSEDNKYLGVVNVVTNTTHLTLSMNAGFTSSNSALHIIDPIECGIVQAFDGASNLYVTNCAPVFQTGSLMIGISSSAVASVNAVTRQNVTKTFSTFVNMTKYVGAVSFGSFINNESLYQSNLATANAVLHSVEIDSGTMTMYTSNQNGLFVTGTPIVGNTSDAMASITAKYYPELIHNSGKILYLENISPVLLDPDQTVTFKITVDF